ncbi:MAG: hypothetical protein J6W30_08970, partial [Bacteroidales bacterium]|nr:hypothetical protein [Bacteroidales bacterium]
DINVGLSSYSNSTAPFNGWNLIGNPFTCDAYLLDENGDVMPFYRMNDSGDAVVGAQPGTAIKPCEGVFVYAPNDGAAHYAVFTTTAPETVGEAQNDLRVALPTHNLIGNQDASNGTVTQTIELVEGWNWVSTYIEAEDPVALLQMLEAALGENASQISSSELFTENDGGDWWGDLDEEGVTNEQMFMILVETPCTIELEGMPANPADHAITINPGWNWIGFPCDHEMTIEEALGGFDAEDGDTFANSDFFTEFEDGEWFGDVETLLPGQGFMYFSNSDEVKTLVFTGLTKK